MKTNVIGKHKTSIKTDNNGFTNVIYHNTSVVSFKPGHIIQRT